ncbi:hypothetical protein G6F57_020646 [Rhizopus arrhizus]|nr:hypothetical protein G6F57_020646 [Rhizopus arrhizus]
MLNTREDRRNQLRIRARLGVRAELSEAWTAGIRLATGSDDSPVSTSQTLGGGMGKKDIWLDQAYLTYRPAKWATVTGGRIANPFEATDTLPRRDLVRHAGRLRHRIREQWLELVVAERGQHREQMAAGCAGRRRLEDQ